MTEGYCFLVDPADPFDSDEWHGFVRMEELRPGDLFGFVEDADPRLRAAMDEGAPRDQVQAAFRALFRDAARYRFVEGDDPDPDDGRSRGRAELVDRVSA